VRADERERLEALHEYDVLDAPADDELAAVVRVAAMVAGVPTATLNLIDENRQCQLTSTGFEGGVSARADSMCAIRFQAGEFVHVTDASLDPTYDHSPWVTGRLAAVRFYASAPLITPLGHALGTLCVFDAVPHTLGEEQIARLKDLAQVILALFERRRQARVNAELAAAAEAQRQALEQAHAELACTIAELQRSNTELEQFAGVVSHDLAAPLGVVNGYLELIADHYQDDLDDLGRQWISAAARAVIRMQTLIDSLLTYARVGNGPCRRERTDLEDTVQLALLDLSESLCDSGATVSVEPGLPVVPGDPTLLRQLLQNLIGNAIKYRDPARPARIRVAARGEGTGWLVTVADNGIGIPADQRDRVFDMFAQVKPGGAQPGYGVGLSTCQRIVERHGGRIWAGETPGGGATISLTLPGA